MKSIRIAAILVALVTTACAAPEAASTKPSATVAQSAAEPTATASVPDTDALTGTWATGETTCAQQQAAVEAGFTAEQLTSVGWSPECPKQFTIRFADGRLVIFSDGEVGWDGTYRIVDKDTFEAGDLGTGYYITYHYAVDGDQLTIDMIENDYPATSEAELLGEQLAQTEIYETSPFTRQD
ncbi:MAG: hypothetical protein ABI797_07895 [Chloroflexota bacterium]